MYVFRLFIDFGKEVLAFLGALFSVLIGITLVLSTLGLAVATGIDYRFFVLCLFAAFFVPIFLVAIPRYIYWWRYGFPKVPLRGQSPFLVRYRKSLPF